MKLIKIIKSKKHDKKFDAYFISDKDRLKIVSFGSDGMDDFTKTKDVEQQKRYLARHHKNENWSSPMTPGALSRYVLWSAPTLKEGIENYKSKFHFH